MTSDTILKHEYQYLTHFFNITNKIVNDHWSYNHTYVSGNIYK